MWAVLTLKRIIQVLVVTGKNVVVRLVDTIRLWDTERILVTSCDGITCATLLTYIILWVIMKY